MNRSRTLRVCAWCLLAVVVEIGLFTSYRHHDARFHWFTHFFVGASLALVIMAAVAARTRRAVPYPLVWPLAGHIYAMVPDFLFTAGIAHQRWMDVFLGHISSHFVPGRNLTWYLVFVTCLGLYLLVIDRRVPSEPHGVSVTRRWRPYSSSRVVRPVGAVALVAASRPAGPSLWSRPRRRRASPVPQPSSASFCVPYVEVVVRKEVDMALSHVAAVAAVLLSACGEGDSGQSATPAGAVQLQVALQNSELLVGVNRINLALFDADQRPVSGARATLQVQAAGAPLETRPLQYIGPEYGNIPIYVGAARFAQVGVLKLVVRATLKDGRTVLGQASSVVTSKARELAVGAKVPALKQPILGDPGVKISDIDSGVPPDAWHTATIADGLAQHRPMVLYFGEPGFCKSKTCGPTVQVLQQLAQQVGDRLLFEHIEDHYPAGPDETSKDNPAFTALGLQTDPWVYFVTGDGVVSDRFEGPVTVDELRGAADGTLAGRVPAVDIPLGGQANP